MDSRNEKLVRFNNDGELTPEFYRLKDRTSYTEKSLPMYEASAHLLESTAGSTRVGNKVFKFGRFRVFPESQESLDQPEPLDQLILDPGSEIFLKWNRVFLFWCLVSLFVDPLFFLLPSVQQSDTSCMDTDLNLALVATFFRTLADIFYILHMVIGFRTAYVSPVSRVFGKGELVRDPKLIARRYLRSDFFKDLVVALPFPQIVIWFIMPAIKSSHTDHTSNALLLVLLLQYVPRLYLVFPLSSEIIKATKVVTNTAWAGAAYNLLLYVLSSHLAGACWYLLATERNAMCLESECKNESSPIRCLLPYLDCRTLNDADRMKWANSTSVYSNCDPNNSNSTFAFGIYTDAMGKNVVGSKFIPKYLYVLWWGLQQVSSYAQNLNATTFIGETLFTIHIVIVGLVLFALFIGNMQNYLLSITTRVEKWRIERRDTEEWMSHRQLPPDLRERVRRFVQYKWVATHGVNEESILRSLPPDLRRDIQRHLCLDLVRRVHFFSQMDDQLLDAICERLVSSLSTQGTYIVREDDPVTEMLFIIRGVLESSTTNGGLSGFFNSITLRPGDFCGEELLAWALLPNSSPNLPSSTRTVKALVEVEAFALRAADVKFIANQFRRLHSKKLQNTFRFYSHHWRTWAACFIQAAWRRHKKRLMARNLSTMESFSYSPDHQVAMGSKPVDGESIMPSSSSQIIRDLFVNILSSRLAANRGTGTQNMEDDALPKLPKPEEPDFSVDLDHI